MKLILKKLLNFDNNKFFGVFNDNELSVSFNFNDIQSNYEVGIKNVIKKQIHHSF